MANLSMAGRAEAAQAGGSWATGLFARSGLYAIAVAIVLAPAIWNRFPFVFADTGGYLRRPFAGSLELGRSALYGAFLAPGIATDFWPNIILQAVLCVWMTRLVLRSVGWRNPSITLIAVAALCICTSLPWYAGDLEPDVFVPVAVLAFYLLAFAAPRLRAWEIAALLVVAAFAIAVHMSIYAILLLLLAFAALLRVIAPRLSLPQPQLLLPAIAIALGTLLSLTSNFAIGGSFAFTPGGSSLLFARLLQDGFVRNYLDAECPELTLSLCRYRDDLPDTGDDWLWGFNSPLGKLGGWRGFEPEANRIILGTMVQAPVAQVVASVRGTIAQLGTLGTGDGFGAKDNHDTEDTLRHLAPDTVPAFEASAQQHDGINFHAINLLHVPVGLAATIALPLLIVVGWRRRTSTMPLALIVFAALLGNAFVCATFSEVGDRYQSRIVSIAVLAAALAGLELARSFRHGVVIPDQR